MCLKQKNRKAHQINSLSEEIVNASNQIEILELKNTITEIKISVDGVNSRIELDENENIIKFVEHS